MANINSQIKRNSQNTKRRLRNRNIRGAARTSLNQARAAVTKNAPESKEAVMAAELQRQDWPKWQRRATDYLRRAAEYGAQLDG